MRLTMVVREAQRPTAQAAANTLGQGTPFNPALVTPPDAVTVTARWCSWVMTVTERDNLLAAFRAQGFSARESTVIDSSRSPKLSDRLFVFDGDFYSSDDVLRLLGFAPFQAPE